MRLKTIGSIAPALMMLFMALLACNLGVAPPSKQALDTPGPAQSVPPATPILTATVLDDASTAAPPTATAEVAHQVKPADLAVTGRLVYDVESEGTAPEHRAPYGDSYDINRLERPFLQDMTYNPGLDISTYSVGQDAAWYYVSIALVGGDPNGKLPIDYAVELDTNHDGFGDYLIWAQPPYATSWDTASVRIFQDTNHDTGGVSAEKSDAPLRGDGYDSQVFNGGVGDTDPDIAWVRVDAGVQGNVQFAFKRSWSGNIFMLGVMADAGLKDPKQLDYVDRFGLADAGSPIRDNKNYPLKAIYAVDNVCREAFGFRPTGYEPQLCPHDVIPATKKPKATLQPEPTPVQ